MNHRQAFFLTLVLTVFALTVFMFIPFLGYILAAAILGYLLHPAQEWLAKRTGRTLAASILVLITIVAVIAPLIIAGVAVAEDAQELIEQVQSGQLVEQVERQLASLTGQDVALTEGEKSFAPGAGTATAVLGELLHIGAGIPFLVILQFYALRDGDRFVNWTKTFDIIPTDMQNELYRETGAMINAVVKGHLFVAVLQVLVIGAVLWIVGIPNATFWLFVTVLVALVPFIGTPVVWVQATVYLFVINAPVNAAILFIVGAVAASVMDDIVRPMLVEGDIDLHEAFILIGVIGGIFVFGPIGLFIGPVLFGLLRVLLELFKTRYPDLQEPM